MDPRKFVAPKPMRSIMRMTNLLNQAILVRGLPILRYIPGFRPVTRITKIVYAEADLAELRSLIRPGTAAFITPNHPEFFTDWMMDKWLLDQVAPEAASWATHTIVNGMGNLMQRFWLANNLIAQVPGSAGEGKQHSVYWAGLGKGVLLHPEGQVGWHRHYVGRLYPGAIEMAMQAARIEGLEKAVVIPVAWKFFFVRDETRALSREYRYICKEFGITPMPNLTSAAMAYHLYDMLLVRDERHCYKQVGEGTFWQRREALLSFMNRQDGSRPIGDLAKIRRRWERLDQFAAKSPVMSQEEAAEHLKRIRMDFCTGGLRNRIHQFVPRPVGERTAEVRIGLPIPIARTDFNPDRNELEMEGYRTLLRSRLQALLDGMDSAIRPRSVVVMKNPFHESMM